MDGVLFSSQIELCSHDLRRNRTRWTFLAMPSYNLIYSFTSLVGSPLIIAIRIGPLIMLARPRSKVSRWGMFAETHL